MTSLLLAAAGIAAIAAPGATADDEMRLAALDTIIVTAKPNPEDPPIVAETRQRLSRTPGAVSVIANESFEGRTAQGLYDILRDVPGVLAQKRYGEEARVSIRGSGIGQSFHQRGVLFAQDGVPFADADGFADFQKIDPTAARYVEVYRGGNALRFGGAQLGGALNFVTPTGRTAQTPNMLRMDGGSYGFRRAAAQFARSYGAVDAFAALAALKTDGYREHSEQEQYRGTLNFGYRFGEDREIRLISYAASIKQEVPGTLSLTDALATPRRAGRNVIGHNWRRNQVVFRNSLQGRWRFNPAAMAEGGVYATQMDLNHPISLLIDQQVRTYGAFGRVDWEGEIGGHRADLYAGFSYRRGRNKQVLATVTFPVNGNGKQEASGLDLFAEGRYFVTDRFALVAGGSFGRATRDYTDKLNAANNTSKDFDWFAPRVGVLWENEAGTQIYANVTRSVEPPHYGALVQAPFPGFVPVAPQQAWTGEIGTRGRSGAFVWDIAFYRAKIENELLSFITNPGAGIPAAVFNADSTVHQGIEAALDWHLGETFLDGAWLLRQSYTFSDFHFDGDSEYFDNRIPVMPEHQYRAMLRYESRAGWFIAPNVEWRPADTYVDYANTLKAPGYAIVSVNAGWDFPNGLSLFIDARNLGGKAYMPEFGAVVNASGTMPTVFYPGEGRSVFGGVTVRF